MRQEKPSASVSHCAEARTPLRPGNAEPVAVVSTAPARPAAIGSNLIENFRDDLRDNFAVRNLEDLDDQLMVLKKDHDAECLILQQRYEKRYAELLERRLGLLLHGIGGTDSNLSSPVALRTPPAPGHARSAVSPNHAVDGFWRTTLQNSVEFRDDIERYDEAVLDYLRDIQFEWLSDSHRDQGFRVRFIFEPNPYFSNEVLEKVYQTEKKSAYETRLECAKIDSTKIDWFPGKNVTVDVISRKPKSAGRRRPLKPKEEEIARPSLFRAFFRNLGPFEEIPEEELDNSDGESMDLMDCLLEDDYAQGLALVEHIIPHGVRWFTGEACTSDESEAKNEDGEDEGDDDDDDDGEGDDEDEEDEEEDDDEKEGCRVLRGVCKRQQTAAASSKSSVPTVPKRKGLKVRKSTV